MEKKIPFSKLNGSGNDFLLIDNRGGVPRRADFRWQFYNADGSRAEMCGNGGRCAARFAVERGIARRTLGFETDAGLIRAEVKGRTVKLQMTPPHGLALAKSLTQGGRKIPYSFRGTGVPPAVMSVPDLEKIDLMGTGRGIRTHRVFAPRGTNVNFVRVKDGTVWIRTYERGVEGETLACGTGAVAAGILSAVHGTVRPPAPVRTRGRGT